MVSGVCELEQRADQTMPTPTASSSRPKHQRGGGLEPLVAVGVVFVGVFLAGVVGREHYKVRHQIRQRMDTVRDQALRLGQHTDRDLRGATAPR